MQQIWNNPIRLMIKSLQLYPKMVNEVGANIPKMVNTKYSNANKNTMYRISNNIPL